jgi:hypothetical protein
MGRGIILIFAALVLAASAACGSSRDANEDILSSLPVPPGAQLRTVDTYPVHDCALIVRRTLGYVTHANYRAPADMTADEVIRFYVERLGDQWMYTEDSIPVAAPVAGPPPATPQPSPVVIDRIPTAYFERGKATLTVITYGTASPGSSAYQPHDFTITIDSEGKEERPYCD